MLTGRSPQDATPKPIVKSTGAFEKLIFDSVK
jgi:hypothetical protein